MTVFETVGRGSIPRWGTFRFLNVVWLRRLESETEISSRGLAAMAAALQADDRWFESTRDDLLSIEGKQFGSLDFSERSSVFQAEEVGFESHTGCFGRMVQLVDTRRLERRAVRQ